jgi:hypothetical protein
MRTRLHRILPPFLSGAVLHVLAAEELKNGNNAAAQARSPAEEQSSFRLPPGFSIELVASEETGLPKPVTVAFDDSGRLWSVTATEYPRNVISRGAGSPRHRALAGAAGGSLRGDPIRGGPCTDHAASWA